MGYRTVARPVVDDDWPINEGAAYIQVSWQTVNRWVARYLAGDSRYDRQGLDRPSRRLDDKIRLGPRRSGKKMP